MAAQHCWLAKCCADGACTADSGGPVDPICIYFNAYMFYVCLLVNRMHAYRILFRFQESQQRFQHWIEETQLYIGIG